jgi:uncharacterized protein (DUF433 family)
MACTGQVSYDYRHLDTPMSILDALTAPPAPIQMDSDGVLRVGGTRVRLDSVIGAFHSGCDPEEILLKYPSLNLTDIYAVLAYYLWHRAEVDAYLGAQQASAEQVRKENESRFSKEGVRQCLIARRRAAGGGK